jgi:hypothetical protein
MAAVERFTDAWGLAVPTAVATLRERAREAGLADVTVTDITANSVGRFGFWSSLFVAVSTEPLASVERSVLARAGVDLDAVRETVAATRPALPHLRHVVVTGRS